MSHVTKTIITSCLLLTALLIPYKNSVSQLLYSLESSRSLAMGNSVLSTAEDENALIGNPAGLVYFSGIKVTTNASYQNYSWGSVNLGPNYSQLGGALSLIYNNFGLIIGLWQKGDKENEWTVAQNKHLYRQNVKFIYYEQFINACYSIKINPKIAIGFRGKYLFSDVHDSWKDNFPGEYKGFVMDIGLLFEYNKAFIFGITIDNFMNLKFKYFIFSDLGQPCIAKTHPMNFSIGIRYKPQSNILLNAQVRNLFEGNVEIEELYNNHKIELRRSYHFGGEYWIYPHISLRAGFYQQSYPMDFSISSEKKFNYMSRNTFSFGIGFWLNPITFDFAVAFDNRKKYLFRNSTVKINNSINRYLVSLSYTF